MNRAQLEHIIRAASAISEDPEIVVVGSQAILGQFPDAPAELLVSMEADVYPKTLRERWNLIDGVMGELSAFHDTFGYYAQGVEQGTAVLPLGWESRLVVISNLNTSGAKGYCLEAHDLVVSKLLANRAKDKAFARVALSAGLVKRALLLERLASVPRTAELRPVLDLVAASLQP